MIYWMSDIMDCQNQLNQWAKEYGLDSSLIRFRGWQTLGTAMGRSRHYTDGRTEILLHRSLMGHSCAE